jgi:hypothetical protein
MKTSGYIPSTLLAACLRSSDKISEVSNEGEDGYWIYCRDGWWNAEGSVTAIHERTVKDCISMLRYLKPDPRPETQR